MSPWLEDWDSVQFALALHNFSIVDHQPHAPGYPIYILLGRFIYLFTNNDTQALVLLSSLLGSAVIIPFYLLTRTMFGKLSATIASFIFILVPIEWVLSETALTNIPGLFFLILWTYFLFTLAKSPKRLLFVSFAGGLILGVRFTELPIILALLGLVLLKHKPKYIFTAVVLFCTGALTWLIPLIAITGIQKFINSYIWIANYIAQHDAFLDNRPDRLWYLLTVGYTPYFLALSFLVLLWFSIHKKTWRQFKYQFLFVWLVAYIIPLVFVYNLEVPRYTLPLLPPLAILTAAALSGLIEKKKIFVFLTAFLFLVLFKESYTQVKLLHTAIPPTIAPVLWVKDNLNPEDSLIITTFTYRQFQYYLPEFQTFYGTKFDQDSIPVEKTVIIDYMGLKNDIKPLHDFEIYKTLKFQGNKDIFPRISEVMLYILRSKK